ncbi:MAG: Ig-like domain-containing protein, partial [Clostridia bacterium]|nr:Ig-like domain-containing protein [Clostridia bacterium]
VASSNKGFAMKKPTVTTVTWHTTDETVVTVDGDGTVTAVGPGEATVFALSDDGYYRSSCAVTVE